MKLFLISEERSGTHLFEDLINLCFPRFSLTNTWNFLKQNPTYRDLMELNHCTHYRFFSHIESYCQSNYNQSFFQPYLERHPSTKFVHLIRGNKIRQAISLTKLKIDGGAPFSNKVVEEKAEDMAEIDPHNVNGFLRRLVIEQALAFEFFDTHEIHPLRLIYEADLRDSDSWLNTMRRVSDYLGNSLEQVDFSKIKKQKISGTYTDEFYEDFVSRSWAEFDK